MDLIARVCALVPPPRLHMVRYRGVLSSFAKARSVFERPYLEAMLETHNGSATEAARGASVDRVHFSRRLWKHGLRRDK